MGKLISIGKILNFHGIKGEVKMGFTSGKEDLIKQLKTVFVYIDDNKNKLDVQSVRFHKNFAIVKFKQINSVNDVLNIKGLLVHVEQDFVKSSLVEDEFLVSDLVGIDVFDESGTKIGVVTDMGANGASDLIQVLKPNGLKFIVPFVKDLVPVVDIANNRIIVKIIDGLDTTLDKGDN